MSIQQPLTLKTAKKVLELTGEIVAKDNLTTLMITHNMKDATQTGQPSDHDA